MLVSEAAPAAPDRHERPIGRVDVRKKGTGVGVEDLGAEWDANRAVGPVGTVHGPALARPTVLGPKVRRIAEAQQRVHAAVAADDHAASVAAVTAVRRRSGRGSGRDRRRSQRGCRRGRGGRGIPP